MQTSKTKDSNSLLPHGTNDLGLDEIGAMCLGDAISTVDDLRERIDRFTHEARARPIEDIPDHIRRCYESQERLSQELMDEWLRIGTDLEVAKTSPEAEAIGWEGWVLKHCKRFKTTRRASDYTRLVRLVRAATRQEKLTSDLAPDWITALTQARSVEKAIKILSPRKKRTRGKAKRSASKTRTPKRLPGAASKTPASEKPQYDPFAITSEPILLYNWSRPVLTPDSTAGNAKTGAILTVFVGPTKEHALMTCDGCPRLAAGTCYVWLLAHDAGLGPILRKARYDLPYYSQAQALSRRNPKINPRMVRFNGAADLAGVNRIELLHDIKVFRAFEYVILAYCHFWRIPGNQELKSFALASCETPSQADKAMNNGWGATVVLDQDHPGKTFRTPEGRVGRICLQETGDKKDCASCGLCEVREDGSPKPLIGFREHGPHLSKATASTSTGFDCSHTNDSPALIGDDVERYWFDHCVYGGNPLPPTPAERAWMEHPTDRR